MEEPICKNCKWMKPLHNHCTFNGVQKGDCVCDIQLVLEGKKVFVCFNPESDRAHIMTGDGGCEMFESKFESSKNV